MPTELQQYQDRRMAAIGKVANAIYQDRAIRSNPQLMQKAIELGTDTTTVFGQSFLDPLLQIIVNYGLQVWSTVPKKPGQGISYLANQRDAATETVDESWVQDTVDLDTLESTGEYEQVQFLHRTAAKRAKISNIQILNGKPIHQVLEDEIEAKMDELKRDLERALFYGDISANVKQPNGWDTLCIASQKLQAGSGTTGSPLTLAKFDEMIDLIESGDPTAICMNKRSRRELSALLQTQQQFMTFHKIRAGFTVMWYNDIPILTSPNISIVDTFNGTTTTSRTGGNASRIFCVNWKDVFESVVQALTTKVLGAGSILYEKIDLMTYLTNVVRNPLSLSELEGVYESGTP